MVKIKEAIPTFRLLLGCQLTVVIKIANYVLLVYGLVDINLCKQQNITKK